MPPFSFTSPHRNARHPSACEKILSATLFLRLAAPQVPSEARETDLQACKSPSQDVYLQKIGKCYTNERLLRDVSGFSYSARLRRPFFLKKIPGKTCKDQKHAVTLRHHSTMREKSLIIHKKRRFNECTIRAN